jgi:hypothetical protein
MISMRNVTTRLRTAELLSSITPESARLELRLKDLDPHIRSADIGQDTFVVDDLLKGYSYVVARSECHYQLTFMLKDGRQVNVAVELTGDAALVAQRIAERLMESGNRVVRLGLGPATKVYQRSMMG